jgi:hypothetical protein
MSRTRHTRSQCDGDDDVDVTEKEPFEYAQNKRKKENTIKNYQARVNQFKKWLIAEGHHDCIKNDKVKLPLDPNIVLSFFGFLTKSATAFNAGIELKLLNSRIERIKSISLCESDALYAKLYAEVLKKLRGGDIPSREEAICYGTIYTWISEL